MKYIAFETGCDGNAMQVSQTATPKAGQGQVLVKVAAFGVNRADTLQRQGKYPPPDGESEILGLEVAGTIAALGEGADDWREGDSVFGLVAGGGYAEYVAVDQRHLLPVPASVSLVESAGIAEVFLTAYQSLFWLGKLKQGQKALIHAGASGVGLAAIQLAHRSRCQVAATASNDAKLALCRQLGADLTVNYHSEDFVEAVKAQWSGLDVIIDFVGGDYLNRNLSLLRRDGSIIYLAMLAGRFADRLDLGMLLAKRANIIGSTLRNRDDEYKAELIASFREQFLADFEKGHLKPVIDTVFSEQEIGQAHLRLEANQSMGKFIGVW